jgi:hypothetical protein
MRSASKLAALLALLCACGNLSNEDIAFIEALPKSSDLHLSVPVQAALSTPPACALGDASQWTAARDIGDKLNAGVDGVLAMVDAIRLVTPTRRAPDLRVWGPFPDKNHPGVEFEVSILRIPPPPGSGTFTQAWSYAFDARRNGGPYLEILYGVFLGAQASNGFGELQINFDNSRTLQINNPNDPNTTAVFHYDLSGDPRTLQMDLGGGGGLGLSQFDYFFAGFGNGSGRFDYAFPDAQANFLTLNTQFTAVGAGKADIVVRTPAGATASLTECWDASACLSYIVDPLNLTPACALVPLGTCVLGNAASCPTVP